MDGILDTTLLFYLSTMALPEGIACAGDIWALFLFLNVFIYLYAMFVPLYGHFAGRSVSYTFTCLRGYKWRVFEKLQQVAEGLLI